MRVGMGSIHGLGQDCPYGVDSNGNCLMGPPTQAQSSDIPLSTIPYEATGVSPTPGTDTGVTSGGGYQQVYSGESASYTSNYTPNTGLLIGVAAVAVIGLVLLGMKR